jgi:ubiquinone biosynthesis accessory factor UbiJ
VALTAAAANRLLAREAWARERLVPFAGRAFMVRVGPVTSGFRIDSRGLLESAPLAGNTPDLVLALSPFNVPAMLADPRRWNEFVAEEGDAELASVLKDLAQALPWFVERGLGRSLGPIIGQRVADAGRAALTLPEYAATRVAANVGSYARDEAQVLAHPADVRALADDTALLAARVDALEARVRLLGERVPAPHA